MKHILSALLVIMLTASMVVAEEELSFWDFVDLEDQEPIRADTPPVAEADPIENAAREEFIDRIVELGYELYVKADGKAQSAHYKSDIYLCKNFTTHIFNKLRDEFCMAEYPDVRLRIPNNLPEKECRPYYYGLAWEEIAAEDGNPFYEAASFRYDTSLTQQENLELAMEFMRAGV